MREGFFFFLEKGKRFLTVTDGTAFFVKRKERPLSAERTGAAECASLSGEGCFSPALERCALSDAPCVVCVGVRLPQARAWEKFVGAGSTAGFGRGAQGLLLEKVETVLQQILCLVASLFSAFQQIGAHDFSVLQQRGADILRLCGGDFGQRAGNFL